MPPVEQERPHEQNEETAEDGAWVDGDLLQGLLEGGTMLHLDVQRAVGKGENYLSVLYRARLEYRPADSKEPRVKNVIVKGAPEGEFMTTLVDEIGFFRRETTIYEDALPRLYAFADSNYGDGQIFPRLTAAHHKTSRCDTLILDDLRADGFAMANRRDRLDRAHSTLVVQNMARWHALSLAYDEQHPGFIKQFPEIMFNEENKHMLEKFIPPQIQSIAEVVGTWDGFSALANKLSALENKCLDKVIELNKPLEGGRNVLAHGDCWVNNFLFKYSETKQPIDFRFVDFQLTHEGSPALDLTYFLFSSPKPNVRERHFDDLLQDYCNEFERCAKKLGYGGSPITFEEIRKEVDRTIYFGFISALITVAVVLADPDDAPDLSTLTDDQVEKGENLNVFGKVHRGAAFKETFQALLPFFDKYGVLD